MARAYFWDFQTKIFLGSREAKSLSANSTFDPPPFSNPGFAIIREEDQWQIKEDHRGQTVYLKTNGSTFEIESIGVIPSEYTTLEFPGEFWTWNGTAWEFQLQDRKQSAANLLMEYATRILALSDAIIHDWEEQGLGGGSSQSEYDTEIAKRVALRNAVTAKFSNIKDATTPEQLDGLEAEFTELYEDQLREYAGNRLAK